LKGNVPYFIVTNSAGMYVNPSG